jgi:hypothetical protein
MRTGRQATDAQVKELRKGLLQGASLAKAAMKAGMDRKTARKYRHLGKLPSETRTPRTWRTRPDPLVEVWPRLEELLEREPSLQAKTLVGWLQEEYPERDWERTRRTVERRVRQWRAQHGPAQEVFFAQVHEPGRLGASDFSHMDELGVTIQGQPFPHLIYHFVLTASNWEHVTLCFSESFASLSEGLQNAFGELGGAPRRHRTDRMTLAVHHDGNPEQYTAKYRALLRHYGVEAEATNAASAHENGDCEQAHRRFKEAVAQALLLRGSRDFASREEYWQFAVALVARRNAARAAAVAAEVPRLRPLPARRLETLERERVKVSRGSTIQVKKNTYSVPARLIGEVVEARIAAETIEVWYAGERVQQMERLRGQAKHHIDYRHISAWLMRKPGAFARYVYREDLYPTVTYRRAYDALLDQQPGRADREYVRILHLATGVGEAVVAEALAKLLEQRQPISERLVQALLGQETPWSVAARVTVPAVDLRQYDALLEEMSAESSDSNMSVKNPGEEVDHDGGHVSGVGPLPAGTAPTDGADAVRGGGPASSGRSMGLSGLPAGTAAAGSAAATAQPDRAALEGVEVAAGEELECVRPEALAAEGGAAVAGPGQWGVCGSPRESFAVRTTGFGEDARFVCSGPGAGASGPEGAVHDVQPAGARVAGGETGPDAQGAAEASGSMAGGADRRPGVRAAESGGDGGTVLAVGGALRAGQCAGDEQPGILAVGADLQGPDDDGSSDRPTGASQRHRGDERTELPGRGGEENQGRVGRVIVADAAAQAGPEKPAAGEPRPL